MKKYVSLSRLSTFLDKLRLVFAPMSHKHDVEDLIDFSIDTELSDTSTNPVQNKVLNEEFEAVSKAINVLESIIDGDTSISYPLAEPTGNVLEPERYYTFGTVDSIVVTLQSIDDDRVHEYCFEFTADDEFYGISITPEPVWVDMPPIESGKTYQASILRGIGVIFGA